jgi:RNA polymerase sigma-70 factor (ECF subfamily)
MAMTWTKPQTHTPRALQESATFDALFQQYWPRLCEMLFRLTGDLHEAEDLALEAFMRLYQRPPENEQNLAGWLYRVATNLGLNALRARKRRLGYEAQAGAYSNFITADSGGGQDPAQALEQSQERQRVRAVLASLKPRSATLLLLRYSDLSYAEIAAALQIAPGSVGTLLARAEREFVKQYRLFI